MSEPKRIKLKDALAAQAAAINHVAGTLSSIADASAWNETIAGDACRRILRDAATKLQGINGTVQAVSRRAAAALEMEAPA